jgi:outer membrane murein-binding lipoprotein Lpp
MTNPKSRIVAAVAGALSVGAVSAWAAEPTQNDLKIQQLEAKVAQLEAKQAQSSKDVAATLDAVLRDAEHRSQLLAMSGDMSAGYDNGFFIQAGAWSLRPGVLFQFWNVNDYAQDTNPNGKDQWENGFEVHRLEFGFQGTAVNKDITYSFLWNTDTEGGGVTLLDAWVRWMFADQFGVRMGQFNDPVTHENLLDDGRLLMAERSMLDFTLGGGFLDRTQGVTLVYGGYDKNNPLNIEIGLTDGANQDNTNFVGKNPAGFTVGGPHSFDFGVAGRAEYKVMGDWVDYADMTAKNAKTDLLVLGIAGDWSQSGDGNVITATIDAQYEMANSLGLYGAFIYRSADEELTGLDDNANDYGLLLQASYLFSPQWEVFGRWDWVHLDNTLPVEDEDNFHEFTVGLNYYMGANGSAGHRAKFTVDFNYYPNGVPTELFDTTRIGAQGNNSGDDEWILRAQFQLLL